MRGTKIKAMRRALRAELEKSGERWVAHPTLYTNMYGTTMLRFRLQYVASGGRKMLKLAKKIYRAHGLLPRDNDGKDS